MRSFRTGIFWQYAIALILAIGGLVLVSGLLLIQISYQTNKKHIEDVQNVHLRLVQSNVAWLFSSVERHMSLVAHMPWESKNLTIDERVSEYRQLLALNRNILDLRLLDPQGKEILFVSNSAPPRISSGNRIELPIIDEVRTKGMAQSDIQHTVAGQPPFIWLAVADKGKAGQISLARLSLNALSQEVFSLAKEQSGSAYVLDSNQRYVAHSNRLHMLKPAGAIEPEFKHHIFSAMATATHVSGVTQGAFELDRGAQGVSIVQWRQLGRADWVVVSEQARRVAYASVYSAVQYAALLFVAGVLLALAGSYYLARRLSKPIVLFSKSANRLAQGDLSHRIPVTGSHEMEVMANSFNDMALELQKLSQDLETRLKHATDRLEIEFSDRERRGREIATLEERSRITRDLHDGVGGQLISILGAVKAERHDREALASLVQDALIDFRIALDSISPEEPDLLSAMGNLKHRIEPRMSAAKITATWQLNAIPEALCCPPEQLFHIQRVIVEALTNVVKHAKGARNVQISFDCRLYATQLQISIEDDGVNANAAVDPLSGASVSPRGIANMRARAKAMLGSLMLTPSAVGQGYLIQLVLPLKPEQWNASQN